MALCEILEMAMPESCFFFSKIPIHFFLNNLLTKQPPSLASDLPRKASFLQNGVGEKTVPNRPKRD
jgi:hypothetical protein